MRSHESQPVIREELFEEIVESLKLLPAMLRRVFVQSHYQGKSVSEIAQDTGLAEAPVRSMLRDANHIFYENLHRFHNCAVDSTGDATPAESLD
ncbi:MAG: RNA polymerase sigma factor [Acidobacteriota bacterium]